MLLLLDMLLLKTAMVKREGKTVRQAAQGSSYLCLRGGTKAVPEAVVSERLISGCAVKTWR